MQKGDLVICNDLMGFVIWCRGDELTLNTVDGVKHLYTKNAVVMTTAQEIAQAYTCQLLKGVTKK